MGDLRFVVGALENFTANLMTKLTLDITANLIEDTPVDTGWARANWVPSIGGSFGGSGNVEDRDSRAALTPGRAGLQAAGIAAVATQYKKPRAPIFITNNVPYIVDLNMGTSVQAPSGFVQAAVTRGVRQIRNIRAPR